MLHQGLEVERLAVGANGGDGDALVGYEHALLGHVLDLEAHHIDLGLAARAIGARCLLIADLNMKQREQVVDEQELDVLFKPAQSEDVIPDSDGARRSEDVTRLDIPLQVNDVFDRIIDPGNAVIEDAAPLGDSPLLQVGMHGVSGDDRVGCNRNAAAFLLADRRSILLPDLQQEAIGTEEQIAQNALDEALEAAFGDELESIDAILNVIGIFHAVAHDLVAGARGKRQLAGHGLLDVDLGVGDGMRLAHVVLRHQNAVPHVVGADVIGRLVELDLVQIAVQHLAGVLDLHAVHQLVADVALTG